MKIILTIGDCNGIGIEVMLKALEQIFADSEFNDVDFTIAGRKDVIYDYAVSTKQKISLRDDGIKIGDNECKVIECPTYSEIFFGKVSREAGKLSAEAIEKAVELTVKGKYDAMVTMPVSKFSLYLAEWKYPGHTEMLADYCRSKEHLMILSAEETRVALATIHEPVSAVPGMITKELIKSKGKVFINSLKFDYGIREPMIAVLGLNPHSGENGSIGTEELDIITPAINDLNGPGYSAYGPFPADGFFAHGNYRNYDGILAMYHDQGLVPLKLLAQGGGVNFTAGLNIVRTSPDHGTAFSIAGKNTANPQSTYESIILAIEIANRRSQSF